MVILMDVDNSIRLFSMFLPPSISMFLGQATLFKLDNDVRRLVGSGGIETSCSRATACALKRMENPSTSRLIVQMVIALMGCPRK